jgi:hypothetical protein
MKLLITALSFLLCSASSSRLDGSFIQSFDLGHVDWSQLTVTAKGVGSPLLRSSNVAEARKSAESVAKTNALRAALKTLSQVSIRERRMLILSDETRMQNGRAIETKYFADGTVEVTVEVPLAGDLLASLLPAGGKRPAVPGVSVYTGIVIDAKGLPLRPVLAPRILSESGEEIYSAAKVSLFALKQRGVAAYVHSLDKALQNDRSGEKPLLLKALRVVDEDDVVVSEEDAKRVAATAVLSEGRVVLVAD